MASSRPPWAIASYLFLVCGLFFAVCACLNYSTEVNCILSKLIMARKVRSEATGSKKGEDDLFSHFKPAILEDEPEAPVWIDDEGAFDHLLKIDEEATTASFFKGHKGTPTCLAVHPERLRDGVYSGAKDCCVISWDAERGQKKTIFSGLRKDPECSGHIDSVTGVGGLWNDGLVVSCGLDGRVLLWDERTPTKPVIQVCKSLDALTCLTMIPRDPIEDEEDHVPKCMVGTTKGDIQAWQLYHSEGTAVVDQRKRLFNFYQGHRGRVNQVDMNAGYHERCIAGGDDATARYFNLTKDTHLFYDRHKAPVEAVTQFTKALTAAGDASGVLHLWSTGLKKPVHTFENLFESIKTEDAIITAVHSPAGDSNTLFAGGTRGEIRTIHARNIKGRTSDVKLVQSLKLNSGPGSIIASEGHGIINAMATSGTRESTGGHLLCVMGREQRLGRWIVEKGSRDGLAVIPLTVEKPT